MSKIPEKRHSFTVKGFIERDSPHLAWSIAHVQADTIEEAISHVQDMFTETIMVCEVTRIISRQEAE